MRMETISRKVFHDMNETETKQKEPYEAPVVHDIKPVTVCRGGLSDGDWGIDE